jgi:hypothetical protein
MRRAACLLVAAAATVAAPDPASAVSAATFTGTAHVVCFGCGTSSGTATLTVVGVVNRVVVTGPATASFDTVEPAGATCVITGFAEGDVVVQTVVGPQRSRLFWTRLGAVALITLPDWRANGTTTFTVTSPVGNPCGGPVTAAISGAFAGV